MAEQSTAVVDTNVLLNLATPVVDGRSMAPSGADPLKTVLSVYDVHVPASVVGELTTATDGGDLLAAAAEMVLAALDGLTTHDVEARTESSLEYGLDRGESHAIWLANELTAELFVTDEFNTTNYLFVSLTLEDRNTLFTTPHLLCWLADRGVLRREYVDAALTYYCETKSWKATYIEQLRRSVLRS
jgi:predicted ribonuclease YlaK